MTRILLPENEKGKINRKDKDKIHRVSRCQKYKHEPTVHVVFMALLFSVRFTTTPAFAQPNKTTVRYKVTPCILADNFVLFVNDD
jgi:hypothetical protein